MGLPQSLSPFAFAIFNWSSLDSRPLELNWREKEKNPHVGEIKNPNFYAFCSLIRLHLRTLHKSVLGQWLQIDKKMKFIVTYEIMSRIGSQHDFFLIGSVI